MDPKKWTEWTVGLTHWVSPTAKALTAVIKPLAELLAELRRWFS
ncbi:hypothetical protein [Amycolatopsis sp. cg9]